MEKIRRTVVIVALALVVTSCGTRLGHQDIVAAGARQETTLARGQAGASVSELDDQAQEHFTPSATAGQATSRSDSVTRSAGGSASRGSGATSGKPAGAGLTGGSSASKSPVKIGSVSTLSGPV